MSDGSGIKNWEGKEVDSNLELESLRIMEKCPRFNQCSAPVCPLDLLQDDRDYIPGEPKCALSRNKRMALAAGSDLPRQGLTKSEWAAQKSWAALNETQRQSKIGHLTQKKRKTTGVFDSKKETGYVETVR